MAGSIEKIEGLRISTTWSVHTQPGVNKRVVDDMMPSHQVVISSEDWRIAAAFRPQASK